MSGKLLKSTIVRPALAPSVVTNAKPFHVFTSLQKSVTEVTEKRSAGFVGFVTSTIDKPVLVPTKAYSLPKLST